MFLWLLSSFSHFSLSGTFISQILTLWVDPQSFLFIYFFLFLISMCFYILSEQFPSCYLSKCISKVWFQLSCLFVFSLLPAWLCFLQGFPPCVLAGTKNPIGNCTWFQWGRSTACWLWASLGWTGGESAFSWGLQVPISRGQLLQRRFSILLSSAAAWVFLGQDPFWFGLWRMTFICQSPGSGCAGWETRYQGV